MNTLLNNKIFIGVSIAFMAVLTIFVIAKGISEIGFGLDKKDNLSPNVITVSGEGEVLAVSDIATLSLNLNKEGATSKEAQNLLNESITKTLEYLKNQKIEDKDIKSEYGGINPKYSYQGAYCYGCPIRDQKIIGYTATQFITVKIRAVDSANEIRTGLANLGITDISGPTFSIDNEKTLKDEARGKAIADAKIKAKLLAKQLGVRLCKITSFSENGGGYPIMYGAGAMMKDSAVASAPVPELPKGENKITSNVTITYEIK